MSSRACAVRRRTGNACSRVCIARKEDPKARPLILGHISPSSCGNCRRPGATLAIMTASSRRIMSVLGTPSYAQLLANSSSLPMVSVILQCLFRRVSVTETHVAEKDDAEPQAVVQQSINFHSKFRRGRSTLQVLLERVKKIVTMKHSTFA